MTAEIAIMNKHAIALASDSAVTMSQEAGEKIKTSANKLFALSKYHPVGIMIYGSADIMEVPWETIIKIYRAKLGKKKFGTLKEYSDDFIAFLDNGNPLFPNSVQEDYVMTSIYGYFYFIKDEIENEVKSAISIKNEITQDDVKWITSTIIKKHYENWKNADLNPSTPSSNIEDIINKYNKNIELAIYEIFEKLPIYKRYSDQLKELAGMLFSKSYIIPDNVSGVVIAGFGEIDIFPSLRRYTIEGVANNRLKYTEIPPVEIGFETHASIIPFAQREMVDTFMVGIDPSYMELEESYITEIFSEYTDIITYNMNKYNNKEKLKLKKKLQAISNEIIKDHQEKLKKYRKETYTNPVTSVVSMLPKDELAAMAEALVNLTSFKRKVSMETETVGGPIDVAVISKGDGFIWIKRKHYFKPDLNPGFFSNYYKEEIEDGEK